MDNFFDKSLLQNIVSGLIIMFFGFLLVGKSSKSITGKFWKIVVILGIGMMIGGVYLFVKYFPNGGIKNIYASVGISTLVFGYIFKKVGDFFNWWHK
ncbi:MAG: hypothetical protein PHQ42_01800 [Patescibacteria group bacterium]|nr:hypothetical protein [Patescibacteria group bacterium]